MAIPYGDLVLGLVAELPGWNDGVAYHEGMLWVTNVESRSLSRVTVPAAG